MTRKLIYAFLGLLLIGTFFGWYLFSSKATKDNTVVPPLIPRTALLGDHPNWKITQQKHTRLVARINQNSRDIKSLLTLTALFMQEGRITGNLSYYNTAALEIVDRVLQLDPQNFEGLTFRSMALLSQHQFKEGLAVALQAQEKYPHNAFVYGLLVDANVELGNYEAAINAADKMVSIRPDLRSYSRIAYLREIYGDLKGAIDAMKMAIEAGAPGDESTEWCRIQLAKLYEQTGDLQMAEILYSIANRNRDNYAYAKAGLARIAIAEKKYNVALSLFQAADSLVPDHLFKEGMIEVFDCMGESDEKEKLANEILEKIKVINRSGQNEDHEMAHAYMGVGDYGNALRYALLEYDRRPNNIEMNETVARVYAMRGEFSKALPYIEVALRTNCKKPELVSLASLIHSKTGYEDRARANR
jgi:tetratricopeptide (TPR) repeat protein